MSFVYPRKEPLPAPLLASAAYVGKVDVVKRLLVQGADIHERYGDWNAEGWAKRGGHREIVQLLKAAAQQEKQCKKEAGKKGPAAQREMLFEDMIARGECDRVRAYFDRAFWDNRPVQVEWQHLKTALLAENKPMLRLLITWGANVTGENMAELKASTQNKYLQYVKLLRQCGLVAIPVPAVAPVSVAPVSVAPAKVTANLHDEFWSAINVVMKECVEILKTSMLPQEWLHVLKTFQDRGAPEAVIAGGALRDLFNNRAVKDVDIFLQSRGSERKNKDFLKKVFASAGLKVIRQADTTSVYGDSEAFPEPQRGAWDGEGNGTLESWKVVTHPKEAKTEHSAALEEYNIIFVDGATGPYINRFDFGLCQISCDGRKITTTPQYDYDVANKQITLAASRKTRREHLERIIKKYPDWKLCPESQKLLAPAPKASNNPLIRTSWGGY